jgi:predicted RNase H-like nuclease (RuvC/YqgF family)
MSANTEAVGVVVQHGCPAQRRTLHTHLDLLSLPLNPSRGVTNNCPNNPLQELRTEQERSAGLQQQLNQHTQGLASAADKASEAEEGSRKLKQALDDARDYIRRQDERMQEQLRELAQVKQERLTLETQLQMAEDEKAALQRQLQAAVRVSSNGAPGQRRLQGVGWQECAGVRWHPVTCLGRATVMRRAQGGSRVAPTRGCVKLCCVQEASAPSWCCAACLVACLQRYAEQEPHYRQLADEARAAAEAARRDATNREQQLQAAQDQLQQLQTQLEHLNRAEAAWKSRAESNAQKVRACLWADAAAAVAVGGTGHLVAAWT